MSLRMSVVLPAPKNPEKMSILVKVITSKIKYFLTTLYYNIPVKYRNQLIIYNNVL